MFRLELQEETLKTKPAMKTTEWEGRGVFGRDNGLWKFVVTGCRSEEVKLVYA